MGALGSGTRRGQKKVRPVVEDFLNLDILDFNKEKLLEPGTDFKLTYSRNDRDIQSVSIVVGPDSLSLEYNYHQVTKRQEVELTRTSCNYGGTRTWFQCSQCHAKRNTLYFGPDGFWACRQCLSLAYRVQALNPHERHLYRAEKIKRTKLKIIPGTGVSVTERPFRMRRTTHMNVMGQILTHQQLSQQLFMNWFDELVKKADKII